VLVVAFGHWRGVTYGRGDDRNRRHVTGGSTWGGCFKPHLGKVDGETEWRSFQPLRAEGCEDSCLCLGEHF
jgi:hypothetical protein